jgi:hypothetical protein
MKTFVKQRGHHRFQFYRLIYKSGKTAILQIVKREQNFLVDSEDLKERVSHQKHVEIPKIGGKYDIEGYARHYGFAEVLR